MRLAFLAVLALAGMPAAAAAATGPEYTTLDAYLATMDTVPNLPHCLRVAGQSPPPEFPLLPTVNGTNRMLDSHWAYHTQHTYLLDAPDFLDDNNTAGDLFVRFHRSMVEEYDGWRNATGRASTPTWDPATPIPQEFAYDPPEACKPRSPLYEGVALPSWLTVAGGSSPAPFWGYTSLCDFPSLNRLGKAVDYGDEGTAAERLARAQGNGPAYHTQVHTALGGDMPVPATSARDPIFYGWHKYLDGRFAEWEHRCGAASGGATTTAAQTPALGWPTGSAALLAGLLLRLRRARR